MLVVNKCSLITLFVFVTLNLISVNYGTPQQNVSDVLIQGPRERLKQKNLDHHLSYDVYNDPELPKSEIAIIDSTYELSLNSTNNGSGEYHFSSDADDLKHLEADELKHNDTQTETVTEQYSDTFEDRSEIEIVTTVAYEDSLQPVTIGSTVVENLPEVPMQIPPFLQLILANQHQLKEVSTHFKPAELFKNVDLPPPADQNETVFQLNGNGPDSYYFSFQTNTYSRSEASEIKNRGSKNEVRVVKGQYTEKIKDESGFDVIRQIGYIADENGFQPFVINTSVGTSGIGYNIGGTAIIGRGQLG